MIDTRELKPAADTGHLLLCAHCGQHCSDLELVQQDEIAFCCKGCYTVYELLHSTGLQAYYSGQFGLPSVKVGEIQSENDFLYLDHQDIASRILQFQSDAYALVTFRTPQIHCSACVWLLEQLHRLEPGIKSSQVFFEKREVVVRFDPTHVKLSKIVHLLSSIGYSPDLNLDQLERKQHKSPLRSTYLKIGVAGFAFGNIMLFSLPEYLSGSEGVDAQFVTLFGLLNIALSLPVFFYSSTDFFRPAWNSIKNRFWSMDIAISLGIVAMFFRSLYEIAFGLSTGYMDSFTMLVFLLLAGRLFQRKTFDHLSFERDYKSYFPLSVIKMEDDMEVSTAATDLKPGDNILIRNGELLPADASLLSDSGKFDYSFVTGESDAVSIVKNQTCYAGGRNLGSSALFVVKNPVSASYLTRLWNHSVFDKDRLTGIHSLSQQFSRYFSPAVLLIAAMAALYWIPISAPTALNAFTAVLIVACPCALALSAPFTLGWSANLLSKKGIYTKNGEVTEKLAHIDAIIFDKTGTLTTGNESEVTFVGRDLTAREISLLYVLLHENNHPLGRAVLSWVKKTATERPLLELSEYRSVTGQGVEAIIDKLWVRSGSASWVGVESPDAEEMTHSRVYISFDDEIPGYFEIVSKMRDGIEEMITGLDPSYNIHILSGDTTRDLNRFSGYFPHSNLHFRKSPQEKLQYLEKLKRSGHKTLMIGDGLNDAGALKASDVGISISENTGGFTPASDVIMQADRLKDLGNLLKFASSGVKVIYVSFGISVLYNIVGLGFAVSGTLSPLVCAIIMPVSSVTVIAYTSVATHWAAWRKGLL